MKITKVIREFMEETLSAKRLEANNKARADYDARRKACIEELKALRESIREPVENILRKYNMDTEYKWCPYVRQAFDEVWKMNENRIQNEIELAIIRNKETERARRNSRKPCTTSSWKWHSEETKQNLWRCWSKLLSNNFLLKRGRKIV